MSTISEKKFENENEEQIINQNLEKDKFQNLQQTIQKTGSKKRKYQDFKNQNADQNDNEDKNAIFFG